MSPIATPAVHHPLAMQFIGRIGRPVYDEDITDQGMCANLGNVLTSVDDGGIKETPVTLISFKSSANSSTEGELCSITCKMIGSNTEKKDQLHFTAGTKVKIAEEMTASTPMVNEIVNKIAMIGLGLIIKKNIIEYTVDGAPKMIELLLKSVDFDPIDNNSPVMWLTKHYVHAALFPLGVQNQFEEGEEVQISGMVIDYDDSEHMWKTHVYGLATCGVKADSATVIKDNPMIVKHMEFCCAELFHKYRVIAKDRYKIRMRRAPIPVCSRRQYARYILWKSAQLERLRERYPNGRRSSVA